MNVKIIKMNKSNIGILLVLIFTTLSCGPKPEQIAKEKFTRASNLFEEKKFNEAKLILDSIIIDYPKEIEFVTRSEDLVRKIEIGEQERNLLFLDSILKVKQEALNGLMKNFIVSEEYGEKQVLIHKRQQPQNSYGRSYLRAHLNMDGEFYISSNYVGSNYIKHDQIKVYHNNQVVLSEKIVYDDLNNRRFEDGGTYWEIVKYKNNADNGIIDFIAQNVNLPLKVEYIGSSRYYIVMEKFDKEAIRDGYEISFVLKEVAKLKTDIKNTKLHLDRLK